MFVQKAQISSEGINYNQLGLVNPEDCSFGVADARYVHEQPNASDTWTINHGLGKVPSIMIYDSAGTAWELVTRLSDNGMQTIIKFGGPFSGTAHCN